MKRNPLNVRYKKRREGGGLTGIWLHAPHGRLPDTFQAAGGLMSQSFRISIDRLVLICAFGCHGI